MLTVVLRPSARRQLEAMRPVAHQRLLAALHVLAHVPHSGRPYPGLRDTYSKTVKIRRNWNYRIVYVYKLDDPEMYVEYFEPGWMPRDLF